MPYETYYPYDHAPFPQHRPRHRPYYKNNRSIGSQSSRVRDFRTNNYNQNFNPGFNNNQPHFPGVNAIRFVRRNRSRNVHTKKRAPLSTKYTLNISTQTHQTPPISNPHPPAALQPHDPSPPIDQNYNQMDNQNFNTNYHQEYANSISQQQFSHYQHLEPNSNQNYRN